MQINTYHSLFIDTMIPTPRLLSDKEVTYIMLCLTRPTAHTLPLVVIYSHSIYGNNIYCRDCIYSVLWNYLQ